MHTCAMACIWRSEVNLEELVLLQRWPQGCRWGHQAWQGQMPLPVKPSHWFRHFYFTFMVFEPGLTLNWSSCVYLPSAGITSICYHTCLGSGFECLPSPVTSLRSHSDDTGKVCYVIKVLTEHRAQVHVHFSGNRMNHEVMINFLLNCFFFIKQYKLKRREKVILLWFVL